MAMAMAVAVAAVAEGTESKICGSQCRNSGSSSLAEDYTFDSALIRALIDLIAQRAAHTRYSHRSITPAHARTDVS